MRATRNKLFNVRVSADFVERLNRAAAQLGIPSSQLARQAIAEKLAKIERKKLGTEQTIGVESSSRLSTFS